MDSINKVLNKRLQELGKLAEQAKTHQKQILDARVSNELDKLSARMDNLELQQRKIMQQLTERHENSVNQLKSNHEGLQKALEQISERLRMVELLGENMELKYGKSMTKKYSAPENAVKMPEPIKANKKVERKEEPEEEFVDEIEESDIALSKEDLQKVGLSAELEEQEEVGNEYLRSDTKKAFKKGIYQTWAGKKAKGTQLPEFTITLYGFEFKSEDSAQKHFKTLLSESKNQENHTQEKLNISTDGWVFEKPVNTVLISGKEFEITKAEAVFYMKKRAYDINISFVDDKMSISDLKTVVAFLCKK